jgi:hypothetical protein
VIKGLSLLRVIANPEEMVLENGIPERFLFHFFKQRFK